MDVSSSYAVNVVFVVCKLETGGVWDTVSVWNNCRFVCFADLFAKSSLDPGVRES